MNAADHDLWRSDALGILVRKPTAWQFVTASEVWIRRNQLEVVGGDAARQDLYQMAGSPLLATTRHRLPQFGAGLVVWAQLAHGDDDTGESIDQVVIAHDWTYGRYGGFIPDWEVVERAAAGQFGGCPVSRCIVRFTDPGDGSPIYMTSHLLRHGRVWLTFNATVNARLPSAADLAELARVEAGVAIVAPH